MIDLGRLRASFREYFGAGSRLFRAPGRVNLIGEHTDYNDGFVLPMAIERETVVAATARDDRRVRVRSLNRNETREFDLDEPGRKRRGIWLDYVEGVARTLEEGGLRLRGADLLIESDLPEGSGLSSSAALEISTGLALASVSGAEKIDRVKLALAGQRAEHEYVGAKVGIMDQFIASLGERGHALLIDCRTFEAQPIPLNLGETVVAICNTGVKHELASSAYNQRREECERGVEFLGKLLPGIRALRDVSPQEFERFEGDLPEPVRRRCRHVVTENARTLLAAEALRRGELPEMRRLMTDSHRSLRDDYEVSCRELDLMVEIADRLEGVWGARMTGGGFGGCTVNLVNVHALEKFQETVAAEYNRATGIEPAIYVSGAGAGAEEIPMKGSGS